MRNNPADEATEPPLVLVIDDDASVRSAIVNLLESVGRACLAFACVEDFLLWPSGAGDLCLVLDVRMPGRNGLDFQEELARTRPQIAVVMITAHGDIPMSVRAMKAGAVEFLPKPFREQELLDAVDAGLARARDRRLALSADADLLRRLGSLSPREHDVMRRVVTGELSKAIAADLALSEITVKLCRASMMRKLGVHSLIELGRIAERASRT